MKQVLVRKGRIAVADVPAPALPPHNVLVEVRRSLISTGTELATVSNSGASAVERASRPGAAGKVFDSIKVRGVARTLALVQTKMEELQPLGYSCAGTVIAVGAKVTAFKAGDRVACAGAGLANHAEIVSVPETLVVKTPSGVDDAAAAFVTVGAIALQGVRRADVRLGETVAVIGLGLIGQITVQLLKAAGCRVVGLDTDASRVERARKSGLAAGDTDGAALAGALTALTGGHGADATLITASTDSSDPARLAFRLTRKKGRVVVVGAVGMDLERSPFYEKEQDFLISCSYGPGRYDPSYEADGRDYPYAFVRWTENRNMTAFLDLVAAGSVNAAALADGAFPLEKADAAYAALKSDVNKPLAVLLTYGEGADRRPVVSTGSAPRRQGEVRLGLIGAGAFVKSTHFPNLAQLKGRARVTAVCAASSANAAGLGALAKAPLIATDYHEVLRSADVDAVLISTRHDSHASIAAAALKAGKHVYLEKPLALTDSDLSLLESTMSALPSRPVLMVGFNRRFSPAVADLLPKLARRAGPLAASYRVNAGRLPAGHWANSEEGGGRLRGEACHMIDLFQALVGKPLVDAVITAGGGAGPRPDENFSAQFRFEDGSLCDLLYTSLGDPSWPKERVEIHWDGRSALIDDFRAGGRNGSQDKGHAAALDIFLKAVAAGGPWPVSWDDLSAAARAAIALDADAWGRVSA